MRMVAVTGSRTVSGEEAKVISLAASRAFREKQERDAQLRALSRRPARGDAESVRFAMRCVEHRIVRGLWVLEISQEADGPRPQRQHGICYLPEYLDHYGTVASGGQWTHGSSSPPVPSNKEIDAAKEAQSWIRYLSEEQARLFTVAALTKRGDRERRVNWDRVKERLSIPDKTPLRTLRDRYDQALRHIVAEMTVRRLEI